jgi:hypothetical protein
MKGLKKFTGSGSVGFKQNIKKLYKDLDNYNADLVTHYKAAYTEWAKNPCDKAATEKVGKLNSMIMEKAFLIRALC